MRQAGLAGVVRGKVKKTTIAGTGPRPEDKVKRRFEPASPNQLWVADIVRREALVFRMGVRDLHRLAVVAAG